MNLLPSSRRAVTRLLISITIGSLGLVVLAQQPSNSDTAAPAAAPAVDAPALPVAIAADNAALHYVGRFDRRDPAGPRCAWPACSVAIRFQGTALNAQLKDNDANRWQVEVDGALTTTLQMRGGDHVYSIAAGLPDGPHTIRLAKATEAFVGTSQILGLQLSAGGKVLPLPAPAHRLEVIGDSISAGYGNEAAAKEEHFSPKTENADLTYGAVAARKLGADYVCEAWSGRKMWPDNTIPELYDRTLAQDPGSNWDFTTWTPDAVLINLATNDFGAKNPDEAGWTGAYEAFIKRLRGHYPHAAIYCAIGPMMGDWGANKPLTTLHAYLAKILTDLQATGEQNVRVIDFGTQDAANGFGADWHPNVKTHQLMAAKLVATLKQDLKW